MIDDYGEEGWIDQALNYDVSTRVMGWTEKLGGFLDPDTQIFYDRCFWSPATKIEHAWQVIDKLIAMGYDPEFYYNRIHLEWLVMITKNDECVVDLYGVSAQQTICKAALRAVENE